ncbi:class II aldolase/adducin family protein [Pseudogemmobacter blasticus]|uniref:Class II aldolase n=1 Tax=Fuscovulum blasticum DSM 2131 TaxID=1188250 RepID=A0A2T4JEP1_FUSBL|nr:class II aldolase/adducin family protein [Fuscovulum blasticum]PTE16356.1 class II aldolase [Fuscovulum blasticum DSM 2131]
MTDDERALRSRMIDTCRKMNATGLNQGTSGNLSVRHGAGLLITPSSMPYDNMKPEDIVEMAWDGTYLGRRPSSEWRFHRDILKARPDVDVVLHCHSVHATAVACHRRNIPAFHYMVAVMGGNTLRCARYATFGSQALSDAAIAALHDRKACLLGQHGQIALGKTLDAALSMAVEVEALAQMYIAACALGEPPVLSDEEMERVIAQMQRMSYGLAPEGDSTKPA